MINHLSNQTSPYLLQHADNPVDWHPWGAAALELAISGDKPILLSIGYAACHWCHVMAHESFENPQIAEIMNEHFVCIKVDREERPDLDKIYQLAHQMLTDRPGGWPLTIVMTPNGHAPFFAGTYFPPEPRFNMPGFGQLLKHVAQHYQTNADQLRDHHHRFAGALAQLNPDNNSHSIADPEICLSTACASLGKQFDTTFGGFSDAPKFPHPTQVELLLTAVVTNLECKQTDCKQIVELTLDRMAMGGLFDHLGGGFFRYSVDREWKIPHFEKMLYDNAQLLGLYAQAAAYFDNRLYSDTAEATAQWAIAEMQQEEGGFAATLDADSQGEEGKYYVWEETDLKAILPDEHFKLIERYFGLFGEPNFEGKWHFNISQETDLQQLWANAKIEKTLNLAKKNLLEIRSQRIRPGLDDKIIAGWNGLMISGLAKSGHLLKRPEYIESAQKSLTFIRNNHWRGDRMLSVCTRGQASLNAYLDDYAFVLNGALDLLQAQWRSADLEFAIAVADAMINLFADTETGGFFFTSHDHESLLYRPKSGADDAIPSGNGAAIMGLLKLGSLIGESRYLEVADHALRLFTPQLQTQPSINGLMTLALQQSGNRAVVIVRGTAQEIDQWKLEYAGDDHDDSRSNSRDMTCVYWIPSTEKSLPPGLAIKKYTNAAVAYVCRGATCTPPLDSPQALKLELQSSQ